jgi:hypothetical protein
MYHLGVMYTDGDGVSKDYAQAVTWFRKAADAGNSMGMANLGMMMYYRGWGVGRDRTEAARWLRRAAELGNDDAKSQLRQLGL